MKPYSTLYFWISFSHHDTWVLFKSFFLLRKWKIHESKNYFRRLISIALVSLKVLRYVLVCVSAKVFGSMYLYSISYTQTHTCTMNVCMYLCMNMYMKVNAHSFMWVCSALCLCILFKVTISGLAQSHCCLLIRYQEVICFAYILSSHLYVPDIIGWIGKFIRIVSQILCSIWLGFFCILSANSIEVSFCCLTFCTQ